MSPQYQIVKYIIKKEVEVMETARVLSGIGVSIDLLNSLGLLDLAMDIIGFPKQGLTDFPQELRKDHDDSFSREILHDKVLEIDSGHLTVDDFVDMLYADFDTLLLQHPHFFVKPDLENE
jgi:hypothetical protein